MDVRGSIIEQCGKGWTYLGYVIETGNVENSRQRSKEETKNGARYLQQEN